MIVEWGFLALLVILFLVFGMRPARKQRQAMVEMQQDLSIGDEIVTQSGIFGSVHQLTDTRIGLEIAPGVVIEMARSAVVRKVDEPVDVSDDSDDLESLDGTEDVADAAQEVDSGGPDEVATAEVSRD